jgi:hypothetical protein
LPWKKTLAVDAAALFTHGGVNDGEGFVISDMELVSLAKGVNIFKNGELHIKNAAAVTDGTWTLSALDTSSVSVIQAAISVKRGYETDIIYKEFMVTNIENIAPRLTADYAAAGTLFYKDDLVNGSISIGGSNIFTDPDSDYVKILSVKSKKKAYVEATVDESGTALILKFKGRGSSLITVTATDETGVEYEYTFLAENIDLPQLSAFVRLGAELQSNPLILILLILGIILLLVLIIAIIAAARRKKRTEDEIQEMLISEMEIESQMLRLASAPVNPATVQSNYRYLPPAQTVAQDRFMLERGRNANSYPPQTVTYAVLPPSQMALNAPPAKSFPDDEL